VSLRFAGRESRALTYSLVKSDLHSFFDSGSFVLVPEVEVMQSMIEHAKQLFEEAARPTGAHQFPKKGRRAFSNIPTFEQASVHF
jgi:hypothetical protein